MSEEKTVIYNPKNDKRFQKPLIDVEEWRSDSVKYYYVHGGFEGTELKFSFFYPEPGCYEGRFFQFMPPVQGSEDASIGLKGQEDKIAFAIHSGAYFVETNMGVAIPFIPIEDPRIIYMASAAAAEYSRVVAQRIYGYEHRPYGYIYGGSGGGYKTISCFENTDAWDGAVPFVIGTPMSIPYSFTIRTHAKRVLRHKLAMIADAVEPGADHDMFDGLNNEEKSALLEFTKMGFPPRDWFLYETLDDGALPVLVPNVDRLDSCYYEDFWTLPGYLGSDPDGSAVRDRICHETTVIQVYVPEKDEHADVDSGKGGVDEAWQRISGDRVLLGKPWIELSQIPEGDLYIHGACSKGRIGCRCMGSWSFTDSFRI